MFEFVDESEALDWAYTMPSRAHANDAGWDLHFNETMGTVVLNPGERRLFKTGVRLKEGAIEGAVGLVCPRSGLAHKTGVTVLNAPGIVDQGYRGEIMVNLINLNDEPVEIEQDDRIGQLVVVPVVGLSGSGKIRGEGGHGSSGA